MLDADSENLWRSTWSHPPRKKRGLSQEELLRTFTLNQSSSALPSATQKLRNPFYPIRTKVASKYRASSHGGRSRTLDTRVTCKRQEGRKLLVRIQNSRKTGGPEVSNSFLILPLSTPSHPGSQSRGPLGGAAAVLTLSRRGTDAGVWPPVNRGQVCREEPVLEVRQRRLTPAAPLQTSSDADAELFTKCTETPRPVVCVRDAPK